MQKYDYHTMLSAILESVDGKIHFLNMARHSTSRLITTLSKRLGVSRPTIYLWLEKFDRDRRLIEEGDHKEYVEKLEAESKVLSRVSTALKVLYGKEVPEVLDYLKTLTTSKRVSK